MSEFLGILQSMGDTLTPEIIRILGIVGFTVLLSSVGYVSRRLGQSELWKQYQFVGKMLGDSIADTVMYVAFNKSYPKNEGLMLAEKYKTRYDLEIDPRMAYVVKQAELWVEKYAPYDFDFLMMLARAENIYSDKKKAKIL